MEYAHSLLLLFLESTFIFIALTLLFQQRKAIGWTGFCIAYGMLGFFACFVGAAGLRGVICDSLEFPIARSVFFMPVLAAFLLVYIVEGTLEAQRIILGLAAFFGFYLYLVEITCLQCSWLGFSLVSSISGATLETLLRNSRDYFLFAVLAQIFQLILAAAIYSRLGQLKIHRFISCPLALIVAVTARNLIWGLYRHFSGGSMTLVYGNWLANLVLSVWLGLILALYLHKLDKDNIIRKGSPLDLFFSFLGGYGRSKELEASLQEWTNRHQLVLRNTCETILLIDRDYVIVEANIAAGKLFHCEPEVLRGQRVDKLFRVPSPDKPPQLPPESPIQMRIVVDEGTTERQLATSLSPVKLHGDIYTVMLARDITEELKLAEEKTLLAEQLAHSQRVESLGLLAGGVAHDFNNYIHAILGHVDVISMLHPPDDPEVSAHLEKIANISEQAGKLTSALVGFARKGKYTESVIDPAVLLRDCLTLLSTQKIGDIELRTSFPPPPGLRIRGDRLQLQQTFINLILNAADALADIPGSRFIAISAGAALHAPEEPVPPPEVDFVPEKYLFISFKDNGCGMDEHICKRVFEPFFTTKPVGVGTGMGLAMAYGIISHHSGWIQVKSSPGNGTEFLVFLPATGEEEEEEKKEL